MLQRKKELFPCTALRFLFTKHYAVLIADMHGGGWWSGEGKGVHSSIFSRGNLREQYREFVSF